MSAGWGIPLGLLAWVALDLLRDRRAPIVDPTLTRIRAALEAPTWPRSTGFWTPTKAAPAGSTSSSRSSSC